MLIGVFGPSAIPSRARQTTVLGIWAGVFLGLAVLAKGFVPLVLIAPVLLIARRMRLAMIASCAVVAAPWYILCELRNGPVFWNEFFWKHQVDRFLHPDARSSAAVLVLPAGAAGGIVPLDAAGRSAVPSQDLSG